MYRCITTLAENVPVKRMCDLLEVSRSGHFGPPEAAPDVCVGRAGQPGVGRVGMDLRQQPRAGRPSYLTTITLADRVASFSHGCCSHFFTFR